MVCTQCGEFEILRSAQVRLKNSPPSTRSKLSSWVRQNRPDLVDPEDVDAVSSLRRPGVIARAEAMLQFIAQHTRQGESFQFGTFSNLVSDGRGGQLRPIANPLISVGWNESDGDTQYMLREVLTHELRYLEAKESGDYFITPKGFVRLESQPNTAATVGFCAMWFSDEVRHIFDDVMRPAIEAAGYEALRIDQREHNNKIDDEIIASIRAARFVVADYTGERGGVYYEAGFAHGLGLPVIFMARHGTSIHFDTRQYNTIFWKPDELDEAKRQLTNRVLATIGRGPLN